MFQNDYRREMDGLRPSPAAVERLNRLLEEGAPARRPRRLGRRAAAALALCAALACPALAADTDPLTIVNNLSDFIFSCIKAVGVIVLGWGIVQLGMSIQSHDASQRTQGILCVFGGLLIAFSKEILSAIGVV